MSSSVLEEYRDAIRTQDTHKRLKLAEDLTKILNDPSLDVVGSGADQLIDGLLSWINSSNFKISCQGLELVSLIATRMSSHFKPHISSAIPSVIDRLGDSKQVVRDQSIDTILKFMSPASNPQYVFDILVNHFNHKNWRVREVLMIVLTQAISAFGASCIQISKITPHLVKLISDPTGQVRDTAVDTMVEIYRHVGERFQSDLMKRNIPEAKLNNILSKFDETQKSGNMVSASQTDGEAIETPVEKKKSAKGVRRSTSFSAGDKKKNHISLEKGMGVSGAVDETDFMTAWEEVADPKVFSTRDVALELERINEILSDPNKDWEKRVEALQQLRSFVKISSQLDDFTKLAKDLEIALRVSVKDLRSSVVKEACITISFMASKMENSFDYLAEAMVPSLIGLIPNSVKIMATSGHAAMRLIIKHTATPRLIPIIVSNLLTSKSKEIRRRSAEYMGLLLEVWDTSVLKMHVALLEEAICKGVGDADSEARAAVRRAYWHFADHYKSRAESLMQKFDSSKQKLLHSDRNLLTTGVNQPTQEYGRIKAKTVRSTSDSTSSKKKPTRNGFAVPAPVPPTMQRSASQLEYKRVTPHMTPRQKSCEDLKKRAVRPASVREGRTRHAQRSVTSQPTSRSGSPKRAVQMPTMNRERSEDYMKVYTLQKTRIPTPSKNSSRPASRSSSRQASRDPSPVRYQVSAQYEKGVTEDAVWNALQKRGKARRQRTASQTSMNGQGSDESDSSSLFSQEPGKKKNIVTHISEILSLLQQDASSSKRDGLISMQSFLHGLNSLSLQDTMHIKEIFNRYFAEPNSKIYSVFLDTLSEFIVQYKNDLQDWLFVLLTRLLSRISTDILPSAQTKISRVLDIVRDSYSYDHQFQIITKYIIDNTQTPSLKMKFHLLQYLTGLIGRMDASDFTNTAPIRLSVSRIVTWISEPKSPEVRSQAGEVVIGLFQLNTAEFTNLLASIPSSIQEGASRVIKTHMNQSSQAFQTPPRNTAYQSNSGLHTAPVSRREQVDKPLYRTASASKQRSNSRSDQYLADNSITQDPKSRDDSFGDHDSIGIHSRIPRKHLFQSSPKDTISTPIKNSTKTPASTPFSYATHMGSTDNSPMWLTSKDASYNPKQYEDSLTDSRFSQNASFASPMNRVADGAEQPEVVSSSVDLMNQISTVLSGPQSSGASEDKKNALLELLKMMRSGYEHNFGDKLQSLVPVLLDLLKHTEATIRCLAARALREVASTQPSVYRNDLKSFITPLLETESDTQSEVSKTAEECCTIVSQKLSADEILPVISPVAGDAPFPTNVSAIKMLNVVSDNCDSASMLKHLDTVVTNLLKAYDHEESSVRKAAVFCLVSVHNLAGADNVSSYFNSLAGSKVKLLNLYIRRSQSSNV